MSVIDASRRMRTTEQRFPVEWFCTNYNEHDILRVPESQRLWAWNHKRGLIKQQKFIDSVLHNYPIPNVILNHIGGRYSIYDGRHRIETMHKFYHNQCGRLYTAQLGETAQLVGSILGPPGAPSGAEHPPPLVRM
jgi:hypothetical protein